MIIANGNKNSISHLRAHTRHKEVRLTKEWGYLRIVIAVEEKRLYLVWLKGINNVSNQFTKTPAAKETNTLIELLRSCKFSMSNGE